MLSSRRSQLLFRSVQNVKGRPLAQSTPSRSYSQTLDRTATRPFASRSSRPLKTTRVALGLTFQPSPRFASTQPSAAAALNASASSEPVIPYEGVSSAEWDALLTSTSSEAPLPIYEHIGWMKELGLDFGWGPTAMCQTLLEHLHITAGLPWWGAICTLALGVRLFAMPLYLRASDTAGRMAAIGPAIKDLQGGLMEARLTGDSMKMAQATQELRQTYAAAGVRPSRMFMPMLVQAPFGFGLFRLVRNMAELPVPGYDVAGLLWFTDLTVPDPLYIMPIASSALMYVTFKAGGELASTDQSQQGAMKFMTYVMPGLIFVVSVNFSAGVQMLFLSTALYSFIQARLFRSSAFREMVGITPMPQRASAGPKLNTYVSPEEAAKRYSIKSRWSGITDRIQGIMAKRTRTKGSTRLSKTELEKARQYEKDRRAEIEAAREQYLRRQRKQ